MGQADINNLRTRRLEHLCALGPELLDLLWHSVHAVLARNPDGLAADIARQHRLKIRHSQISTGAVLGVMATHGFQHNRCVAHILGHRPSLIKA